MWQQHVVNFKAFIREGNQQIKTNTSQWTNALKFTCINRHTWTTFEDHLNPCTHLKYLLSPYQTQYYYACRPLHVDIAFS